MSIVKTKIFILLIVVLFPFAFPPLAGAVFTDPQYDPPNNGDIYQPIYVTSPSGQSISSGLDITSGGFTSIVSSGTAIQGGPGGTTGVYGLQDSGSDLFAIYGNASVNNYAGRFEGIVNINGLLEFSAAAGQGIRFIYQDAGISWPDDSAGGDPPYPDLFGIYVKSSNNALRLVGHGGGVEITDKSLNVRLSVSEAGVVNVASGGSLTVDDVAVCLADGTNCQTPDLATGGGWTDDGENVRLATVTDKVGIGNTNPTRKLEVSGDALITGSASVVDALTLSKGSDVDRRWLHWTQGNTTRDWRMGMESYDFNVYHANGAVSTAASPGAAFLTIDSSGNINIPAGQLQAKWLHSTAAGDNTFAGNIISAGYTQDASGRLDSNFVPSHSWTIGSGSVGIFSQNGPTSENSREWGIGPHGNRTILWKGSASGDSGGDGGWDTSNFNIDNKKSYRFSVWIKKTGSFNGSSYLGAGDNLTYLNGSPEGNPYFYYGGMPALDKWYLLVGYIHSSEDSSTTSYGGMYDAITGRKVISFNGGGNGSTDFKFNSSAGSQRHRSYLYYATDSNARQYFWDPRVEEVDGKEPTIEALLGIPKSATANNDAYFGGGISAGGYSPSATHKVTTPTLYAEQAQIGDPVGGLKGAGTLNTSQLCIDGVCKDTWSEIIPGGQDLLSVLNTGANADAFTGATIIGGDVRIGAVTDDDGSTAGWGRILHFSGGDDWQGWNSDNSDPLYMGRYNVGNNQSDLRIVIGDDSEAVDRLVVGDTTNNARFIFQADGHMSVPTGEVRAKWLHSTEAGDNTFAGNVGVGTVAPGTQAEIRRVETVERTTYADILTINADATTNPYAGHGGGILFKGQTYDQGGGDVNWARIGSTLNDASGVRYGSDLFFDVSPLDNGVLSRAMTIKYNGNVGIGTTGPGYELTLEKASAAAGVVSSNIRNTTATGSSRLILGNDAGAARFTMAYYGSTHATRPSQAWLRTEAAESLIFATNDTERITILSGGNVGIGTAAPNKQLHIKTASGNAEMDIQSATSPYWAMYQDDTSDELRFWSAASNNLLTLSQSGGATGVKINGQNVCLADGSNCPTPDSATGGGWTDDGTTVRLTTSTDSVGIGTTSPGTPPANIPAAKLLTMGNASFISTVGAGDNIRTGIAHYDDTALAAGVGGQIVLGYKYSGNTYTEGAIIKMYKLNGASGDFSSGLKFQVRDTGESLATQAVIDPSGKVGIGITNPSTLLHTSINGTSPANILRMDSTISSNANVTQGIHLFKNLSGALYGWKIQGDGLSDNTATLKFISSNNGVDTDRMTIKRDTGNVGIGTTAPYGKLGVYGNVVRHYTTLGTIASPAEEEGFTYHYNLSGAYISGMFFHNSFIDNAASWLTFKTSNAAGTVGERMRIDKDGNVGIGTTTPSAKLQVNSPTAVEGLKVVSSNYSPFVIRNTADNADLARIDQSGNATFAGTVRLGNTDSKPACSASNLGAMIFDTAEDKPYVCASGSTWKPLDSDYDKDGITDWKDAEDDNANDSNAAASQVLSGYTFYSGQSTSSITGSMTNVGAQTITPGTSNTAITAGYHNGAGYSAGDADLIAGNIKSGVTIFGVTGTACAFVDGDGDGYGRETDCNDSNNQVYPDSTYKSTTSQDMNCDGTISSSYSTSCVQWSQPWGYAPSVCVSQTQSAADWCVSTYGSGYTVDWGCNTADEVGCVKCTQTQTTWFYW